ncbi:hypothetical protein IEQ34_017102 [Dendrobium chrysotoxum]|uniref:NAC domain-containing protein n=1 Tax=Dendrobium chrysotoxum TaxID=161865 RepID=A0AAV7GBN0_DENCH|nr:hypothetical protein IEQ34_017102 [Dendrobium chrysotoxum]
MWSGSALWCILMVAGFVGYCALVLGLGWLIPLDSVHYAVGWLMGWIERHQDPYGALDCHYFLSYAGPLYFGFLRFLVMVLNSSPYDTLFQWWCYLFCRCLFLQKLGMEGDGMLGSHFPPGFRFHPTDQELINQYLRRKVTASLPPEWRIIADIDLYKYNPWELPEKAVFGKGEWFFFSPRDRKYPNGVRPNRATTAGYWKATGTDKPIISVGGVQCIGVKKALVFYKGKPPKGIKTDWVMQEYRLIDSTTAPSQTQRQLGSMRLDDWVLCRVRQKGAFEMLETTSLVNTQVHEEKEVVEKEKRSSEGEWSEHLSYFAESVPEDGENSGEDSTGFMWHSSDYSGQDGYSVVEEKQQPLQSAAAAAIYPYKRKQSHSFLDDFLIFQPSKRLQCTSDARLSPAESVYDNGIFSQYFF